MEQNRIPGIEGLILFGDLDNRDVIIKLIHDRLDTFDTSAAAAERIITDLAHNQDFRSSIQDVDDVTLAGWVHKYVDDAVKSAGCVDLEMIDAGMDFASAILAAAADGLSERLARTEEGQKILDVVRETLTSRGIDDTSKERILSIIEGDPKFQRTFSDSSNPNTVLVAQELLTSGGGTATAVEAFDLKDLLRRRDENNQLAQFLGLSLRAVLPYAETEAAQIAEVGRRDSDAVARQEGRDAERAVTRAQHALRELQASELTIDDMQDDSLDEDFQVLFNDDDEE